MIRQLALAWSVCVAVAAFAAAPPLAAQVAYDSPAGRVEVLGLRRWTLRMLQDSIRRYAPGQELHDAACMVTLRDSLHFAEASVEWLETVPLDGPKRSFLTIKVIEPDQAARVQWDDRPRNEYSSLLPDYASLVLPVTDSAGDVWGNRILDWLQFSDAASREAASDEASASARTDGERLYTFLNARRTEADRARAMRSLSRDGFWVNRMTAGIVLSNFAANDSTWWALVRALRDPNVEVRGAAATVLAGFPARPIDWRPVANDLRLLLGGTNLPAIRTVFELLARTDIAPELAPRLLRDNGEWMLDHLGAETPLAGDAAHRLLVRLNAGKDLGQTRAAWAPWVRKL